MNENFLNKQNHFKGKDAPNDKFSIIKGHDMSLSNSYGEVKSRFQEISQEVLNNDEQVCILITWGIEHEFQQRVTYDQANIS